MESVSPAGTLLFPGAPFQDATMAGWRHVGKWAFRLYTALDVDTFESLLSQTQEAQIRGQYTELVGQLKLPSVHVNKILLAHSHAHLFEYYHWLHLQYWITADLNSCDRDHMKPEKLIIEKEGQLPTWRYLAR